MKSRIKKAIFEEIDPKCARPLKKKHWDKSFEHKNLLTWQRLNLPGRNGNQTGKWVHPAIQHIPDSWQNIIEVSLNIDEALHKIEKVLQYVKRPLQCVIEAPQIFEKILQYAIKLLHKTKQALQNGISIPQYAIGARQNPNHVSQYII